MRWYWAGLWGVATYYAFGIGIEHLAFAPLSHSLRADAEASAPLGPTVNWIVYAIDMAIGWVRVGYLQVNIRRYVEFFFVATPGFLAGLALFRWLTRPSGAARELRCVECAHILKGLSEARCPECGTRI